MHWLFNTRLVQCIIAYQWTAAPGLYQTPHDLGPAISWLHSSPQLIVDCHHLIVIYDCRLRFRIYAPGMRRLGRLVNNKQVDVVSWLQGPLYDVLHFRSWLGLPTHNNCPLSVARIVRIVKSCLEWVETSSSYKFDRGLIVSDCNQAFIVNWY